MLDPIWILKFRSESLTTIFKLFPCLASDYFYIAAIALGYWMNPASLVFRSLSFLVPFGTLCNCLLKNLFQIPRPDITLHLIKITDPYGFPSGDVQVATIFWLLITLNLRNNIMRTLCILPIIGITLSRVYLGVHSIYDVIGGFIFGVIIIFIWQKYLVHKILSESLLASHKNFWLLLAGLIGIYAAITNIIETTVTAQAAIGALIGFGLSLNWIHHQRVRLQTKMHFIGALLSLICIITLAKLIPVINSSSMLFFISMLLKYSSLIFIILISIPYLYKLFAITIK